MLSVSIFSDQGTTPNVTLLLLGTALVGGVSNFLYAFWAQSVSQSVAFDLRNDVFGALQTLHLRETQAP